MTTMTTIGTIARSAGRRPRAARNLLPGGPARTALAAAAAAALLLGCSSDKSTGPGGVAGKYNIVSVSGPAGTDNAAPFVIFNEPIEGSLVRAEIASGFITLGGDGRYSGDATVNIFVDGVPFGVDNNFGSLGSTGGKYTVSGSTVTFDPDDPDLTNTTATLSGGNTLTFSETADDPAGTGGTVTITIVAKK